MRVFYIQVHRDWCSCKVYMDGIHDALCRTFGELHVNEALQLLKISLFDNFNGNASVCMHALREMRN